MEIKLLIGLGNPGREFENTYHNVGQLFIDYLAGEEAYFKKTKHFEYANLEVTNSPRKVLSEQRGKQADKLILIKPLTFMNQSGVALAAAKKYFNVKPSEILVIHDDSDIPLGNFKLSFGRGSAGHQGIESTIKSLRTSRFYRLRIGIRPPREIRRTRANDLVLKKIPPREIKILKDLFREISLQYLKAGQ